MFSVKYAFLQKYAEASRFLVVTDIIHVHSAH